MPYQSAQEVLALTSLLLERIAAEEFPDIHPGAIGHLKAAQVQLDAVCTLLTIPK